MKARAAAAGDHEEAGRNRGPVLGVGAGGETQAQRHPAPRGQGAHRRRVGEQPLGHDRRHPPAVGQGVQRGVQMVLQVLEGRIDQGDVERPRARQHIRQMGRVVLDAGREGEEALEQGGAGGGPLIEGQGAATGLRQDGQEARSGRRLQHLISRPHLGGQHRQGAQLRRGRELVHRHLLLGAARVGQAQRREVGQQRDDVGGRVLQPADLGRETAQLQHQGRLDGVVGVAPQPGALGVGGAEGRRHHPRHQLPVERARAVEMRGQRTGGGQQVGGLLVGGVAGGGEQGQKGVHGRDSDHPPRRAPPSRPDGLARPASSFALSPLGTPCATP